MKAIRMRNVVLKNVEISKNPENAKTLIGQTTLKDELKNNLSKNRKVIIDFKKQVEDKNVILTRIITRAKKLAENNDFLLEEQFTPEYSYVKNKTISQNFLSLFKSNSAENLKTEIEEKFNKAEELKQRELNENYNLTAAEKNIVLFTQMLQVEIEKGEEYVRLKNKIINQRKLQLLKEDVVRNAELEERRKDRIQKDIKNLKEKARKLNAAINNTTNFKSLYNQLVDIGQQIHLTKGAFQKPNATVNNKEFENLYKRGVRLSPTKLFKKAEELPESVLSFRINRAKQLKNYFTDEISFDELKKISFVLKSLDSNNALSEISTTISEVIANSASKMTASSARSEAMKLIRQNPMARLRKTTQPLKENLEKNNGRAAFLDDIKNGESDKTIPINKEEHKNILNNIVAASSGNAVVTLETAKSNSLNAYNCLVNYGKINLGYKGDPKIKQHHFNKLISNNILPTSEELFTSDQNKKISLIINHEETYKRLKAKFKFLKLAKDKPEAIEGLIEMIGNEDINLKKFLISPLTVDEANILTDYETIINNSDPNIVVNKIENKKILIKSMLEDIANVKIKRCNSLENNCKNHIFAIDEQEHKEEFIQPVIQKNKQENDIIIDIERKEERAITINNGSNNLIILSLKEPCTVLPSLSETEIDYPKLEFTNKSIEDTISLPKEITNGLSKDGNKLKEEITASQDNNDNFSSLSNIDNDSKTEIISTNSFIDNQLMQAKQYIESIPNLSFEFINLYNSGLIERFNAISAIAAGDETETKKLSIRGMWTSYIYGKSNQKSSFNISGYKGETTGATIGFDADLFDDSIIGIAYSRMNTIFSFKDNQIGNKMLAISDVYSLYGQTPLTNKLELNGQFSFNKTIIKSKFKRLITTNNYKNVSGNFNIKNFNAEANLTYNLFNKNNILLLPTFSFKYSNQHDGAYTESNIGMQNLSIASRKIQNLFCVYGIRAIYTKYYANNIEISPSINGSIENALTYQSSKLKFKLLWLDKEFNQELDVAKPVKYAYNIGANVLIKRNNIEMLASYNFHAKKKYNSHQGAINLRVLF